jgi:hypothetical protein
MLGPLDETFLHQLPVTFDQTTVSDHRFFDRMWMGCHGGGDVRLITGMAAYKNTNSFDGYVAVHKGGKQFNVRLARPLLPDASRMGVGPLAVTINRPLQEIQVTLSADSEYSISADLIFTSTIDARLEQPHQSRVDGRVAHDYMRFAQIGKVSGWIEVEGDRITVDDWFGARDHSWGVRAGMGGYEPNTSNVSDLNADLGAGQQSFMLIWLAFEAPEFAGYLQQQEDGSGRVLYTDGHIIRKSTAEAPPVSVSKITHALRFVPGTRVCEGGELLIELADGTSLSIEAQMLLAPWCYKGTGYDSGYADERGLGFHRGDALEVDVYDVSHPENVVMPDGREVRPWHREANCTLIVNGQAGLGHFPIISSGPIARYGLTGSIKNTQEK